MFKITNGGLLKRTPTYTGLVFGQPGTGKSTLAVSATRPLLIDLDLGAQRIATKDRARADVVVCESLNELNEIITAPELKNYDTIIIDTFGQIVDLIIRDKFRGSMSPGKWGIIKSDFMQIVNTLRLAGKSVLFLAHESEEKNDEKIIKRPQCQGKAKDELMKVLDFIGYLHSGINGGRILEFGEDESFYAKNTYGFNAKYTLPDVKLNQNDFWATVIETQIKNYIEEQENADQALFTKLTELEKEIKTLKTISEIEKFLEKIKTESELSGGAIVKLKKLVLEQAESNNIIYDSETKKWLEKK